MNKAVLTEIENYNHTIEGIAHETGKSERRVTQIIGNLVLRGKIEGEVNEGETEFIPGMVSKEYKRKIRLGIIAQVLAPLSFIVAGVLPITFVLSLSVGNSFLIDQWKINMFYLFAAVTLLICISSLIVSIMVRDTKTGKGTFVMSLSALIFTIMVSLMIVLFLTLFKEIFGQTFW